MKHRVIIAPILQAQAWPGAVKLIGRERTVCFSTGKCSESERARVRREAAAILGTAPATISFRPSSGHSFHLNPALPGGFHL